MRRAITASAVLVMAASASPAAVARSTSCRLVQDAVRDDYVVPEAGASPESAPSLDIVSADLASDARHVTAVVRVRDLAGVDPAAGTGADYVFGFTVNGHRFSMTGGRSVEGSSRFWISHSGAVGDDDPFGYILGSVSGVFDEDASEVRISSPRSLLGAVTRVRTGDTFSGLWAETERIAGLASVPTPVTDLRVTVSNGADDATTTTTYAAGSPSCVPVGR